MSLSLLSVRNQMDTNLWHVKSTRCMSPFYLYICHIAFVKLIVVIFSGKTAVSHFIPSCGVILHLHSIHSHTRQLLHDPFTEELLRFDRTECFVHDGAFLQFSVSITKMYKKKGHFSRSNFVKSFWEVLHSFCISFSYSWCYAAIFCLRKPELNLWCEI